MFTQGTENLNVPTGIPLSDNQSSDEEGNLPDNLLAEENTISIF